MFQYDFPSEVLLAIFGEVKSHEDLLTLAATCRRFNHLSLQVFFSNHSSDPNSKTITLRSRGSSLEMISALTMSLALRGTSLERLSFAFDHMHPSTRLPHKIHTLIKYIMNLSTIKRVTLHIVILSVPVVIDWKAAYVALLDTVTGKSCSNLHFDTYQWLGVNREWEEDLLSISKTPSWFRIPGRLSEVTKKSSGEVKHLKDYFIQTFPTFLRPFYLRVLKANASVLTGLAFKPISGRMAAIDWGFLITNIYLPVLKRFAISFGKIPQDAIIKFLFKHSHLTNFEFHHIKYTAEPKDMPRGLKRVFEHLEQVTMTPEYILLLLPTMDRMPCLTFVAIIIEDGHVDFSVLEQALKRLSSCVKIELTLDVSFTIGALHKQVQVQSSFWRENGFMLHCVGSYHIRWGWRYRADGLGKIPAWLKRFPELTKITHSEHSSGWLMVERNTLPPFFEQVRLACPAIASISLLGESEWTRDKYLS